MFPFVRAMPARSNISGRATKSSCRSGAEIDEGVAVRRFAVRHLPLLPYSYHALRRCVIELNRWPRVSVDALWRWARWTPWLPDLEAFFQQPSFQGDLIHAWNIPFESLLGPAQRCAQQAGHPFRLYAAGASWDRRRLEARRATSGCAGSIPCATRWRCCARATP